MRRIAAGVLLPLLFCLLAAAPLSARQMPAKEANAECLKCHGDIDLAPRTERGASVDLYVPAERFAKSTHRGLACTECHEGAGTKEDFKVVPHKLSGKGAKDCADCHGKYFNEIKTSFTESHHVKKLGDKFTCASCHDAHTVENDPATKPSQAQIRFDNYTCLACHTDLTGYKKLSGKDVWEQDLSHDFLPNKDAHFKAVRCVECHTPAQTTDMHRILPKDESVKDCTVCHSASSALVERMHEAPTDSDVAGKFLGKGLFDDTELMTKLLKLDTTGADASASVMPEVDQLGFINDGLFKDSYVIGATRNVILDAWAFKLALAALFGVLLHGGLRIVTGLKRRNMPGPKYSEYVYDLHVRLWHWLNAVLFIVLIVTGFSLHFAGLPGTLDFAASVRVHDIAGWMLVANYGVFVVMAIITGNIKQYIPNPRGLIVRWWLQGRFYLWGIFRGEAHPFRVTRSQRFNPLQQAAYLPLMYIMMPLLILSGVWMFFPELTPETILGYPGRWLTASVHYVLAFGFAVFLVVHIYLSTTGDHVLSLVKGMFTGYHESHEHRDEDGR
jgi:thiosulfate reductase cytochrome b subunit